MLSFHRLFSLFAVLASFALLSAARPTHQNIASLHARASAEEMVAQTKIFSANLDARIKDLDDTIAAGKDPKDSMKQITALFVPLTKPSGKLTPDQEADVATYLQNSMKLVSDAVYKTKDMKLYSQWMEMDVAMNGFYMGVPQVSYSAYKGTLTKAGSDACGHFHELHMRFMVNMLGGQGYGYKSS